VTSAQSLKPFSDVPGPRGLPFVGTLWDFAKPNGFGFDKMFEVVDYDVQILARTLSLYFGLCLWIRHFAILEHAKTAQIMFDKSK